MSEEVVETTEEVTTEETPVEESNTQPESFVGSMLSQIEDESVKEAGFWKNLEGKDATEVGKYIKELQSFAGKKGDIPKPDASEEEWSAFYTKLGRPENIEGYDFTVGDEFRELVGEDSAPFFEKAVEGFKEQAYAMGASAEKAEELVDWYLGMVAQEIEETNKSMAEVDAEMDKELRSEWGDGYDGMMNGITAMLKANGMPEENLQFAIDSGLLKDPALAVTLGNIAARFQDDLEIGHHQTSTLAGIEDQLFDVKKEVQEYIATGKRVPEHLQNKLNDLFQKKFKLES
mgnify:FL=1|tara:strand:+ start:1324 stop:2190 length:867 start_codon:yes stop_codon:yes gene_type:complete